MRIQHNIMAMNAYRNYNNNTSALSKNLEKLSSGYKINRAGDDAAGLAISEKMRAQITGLSAAQKNVKDGISLVKTAEGAMQEIHDMLNRMDYLATQSANGTYDDPVDRMNLQKEVDALKAEINRIADSANFNGIKLLDGSLDADGTASITTEAVKISDHTPLTGITTGDVEQGGGTNGTYTINIDKLFGEGDVVEITWGKGIGFVAAGSDNASEGATDTAALDGNTTKLTFDREDEGLTSLAAGKFTGTTTAEQAASIADALAQNSNISGQFDIKAEGSKIILTNKFEGNDQATVTSVVADDTADGGTMLKAELDDATEVDGEDGTTGTAFTFEKIFNNADGMELQKGDTLTIKLTDAQGIEWTAKVTLTDELMKETNGNTAEAIVEALNETDDKKAIYFEANDKTARAEEKIKFSDLFSATIEDNADGTVTTDLKLEAKETNNIFVDDKAGTVSSSAKDVADVDTTSADADMDDVTATSYSVDLKTTGVDSNYSRGDKMTIKGALSDGRTFEFDITAGTEFEVGAAKADTVDNIVDYLTKSKDTITVTDAEGNESEVALKDIFSGGTDKEIKVEQDGGALKFTSQVAGTTNNGHITEVSLTAADVGTLSADLRAGVQKTAASSSVTFDDTLEEGATVTVDGKTYQFVTDAAKAEAGNTAVVVADLKDSAKVAEAFVNTLTAEAGDTPAYTAKADGSTVTLTTTDKGQAVTAPVIEGAGVAHKDAVFQLQPNKLKTGSAITVNGQKFEFVNMKDKDAKVSDGSIRVDVDLDKGDTVEINKALMDAIAGANVADVESVEMAEDGTITIHGANAEMTNFVTFDNGKALTLQIGDTSDNYNQLAVSVGDMHTWGMSIDGINIGTQKGAQAAIDVIKNAINYVSDVRGDLGATQNRLEHTANNLSVMQENIQDAESTIRDTDVAEEMMAYTKNNILIQSAQAMLAQANAVPQGVLQLLG